MKHVYLVFSWAFGAVLLALGGALLFKSVAAGFCVILSSSLVLPPVREFCYAMTDTKIAVKNKAQLMLSLFVAALLLFGFSHGKQTRELEREQKEQRAQQERDANQKMDERQQKVRRKRIKHFNSNRTEIIESLANLLAEKKYRSVLVESNKYLALGIADGELKSIVKQANDERSAIFDAEKTEKLLAELKGIPVQEYDKNRRLYRQLVSLHPKNKKYRDKVRFYSQKIEEEEKAKVAVKQRSGCGPNEVSCQLKELVEEFKESDLMPLCMMNVQNHARYDHDWFYSGEPMFRGPIDAERGYIFYGRSIKFKNQFGTWEPMSYECTTDKEMTSLLDVQIALE